MAPCFYALTDGVVLQALNDARSIAAWRFGSFSTRASDTDFSKLGDLADNVQIKRAGPLMRLKAFAVDGALIAPAPPTSAQAASAGRQRPHLSHPRRRRGSHSKPISSACGRRRSRWMNSNQRQSARTEIDRGGDGPVGEKRQEGRHDGHLPVRP